jgi:uncharacterized SAM-binding protein YcdF (DUF218 family)
MAQTILREFSDPVFLWFGALLVLLVMARKSVKRVRRYISLFLLLTLLASNCFIAYQASRPLEEFGVKNFRYADASVRNQIKCEQFRGVITLGGVIPNDDFNAANGIQLTSGAERIIEPVKLYNRCPNFLLIFTSFGTTINGKIGEAQLAQQTWLDLKVPANRIKIENFSTNTYQNAVQTKAIIGTDGQWLLVTSASHMQRAIQTFRSNGLKVQPIPVDYLWSKPPNYWDFDPIKTVDTWRAIAHEYIGMFYYRFKGWL